MRSTSPSRYPVPEFADLPKDIQERMLAVQEKAGFIPNVFLALSHRPDEFRHFRLSRRVDGKGKRIVKGRHGDDRRYDIWRKQLSILRGCPRGNTSNSHKGSTNCGSGRRELPKGKHNSQADGDARFRLEGLQ